MIITFESFIYNEEMSLPQEKIDKCLKYLQEKFPYEKFRKVAKKHKSKIVTLLKKYTNGKDTIYANGLLAKNEGFRDSFLYEIFIDIFNDDWMGKIMGVFVWLCAALVAVLLYILGLMIYMNFIYTPMDKGIVNGTEFVPEHWSTVTTYIMVGKIMVPQTHTYHIPDTYKVEVKELGGNDTEVWSTTYVNRGEDIKKGDTISWDDDMYDVEKMK